MRTPLWTEQERAPFFVIRAAGGSVCTTLARLRSSRGLRTGSTMSADKTSLRFEPEVLGLQGCRPARLGQPAQTQRARLTDDAARKTREIVIAAARGLMRKVGAVIIQGPMVARSTPGESAAGGMAPRACSRAGPTS